MKKVNWGVVAATTAGCSVLVALVLCLSQQLRELKGIQPELIGEICDPYYEN